MRSRKYDKLQRLIVEELHHRIKNTLATVGAIASQSLCTARSIEHARQAIEGRYSPSVGPTIVLCRSAGPMPGAIESYDTKEGDSRFKIALATTLNELCTGQVHGSRPPAISWRDSGFAESGSAS